jgi:predicted DNA-binding protein
VAHSVRQRLKNIADKQGRPFAEVLQWYAIERFIAQLSRTPHAEEMLL